MIEGHARASMKASEKPSRFAESATETKVLTAYVPLPLAKKVDDWAVKLDRSRGWIVKQALAAWVDREEEHTRLTMEALVDVDAGRSVGHEAVQAWADSLDSDKPLPG